MMQKKNLVAGRCWWPTIIIIVLLGGCVLSTPPHEQSPAEYQSNLTAAHSSWANNTDNLCGHMTFREPLLNVSGFLTARAKPNSTLYLFITPNTSLSHSLYVVEHCTPIMKTTLHNDTDFEIGPLPCGQYLAMLPAHEFIFRQGFPIIREVSGSNLTLTMIFHGGNYRYSIGAFSIDEHVNATGSALMVKGGEATW